MFALVTFIPVVRWKGSKNVNWVFAFGIEDWHVKTVELLALRSLLKFFCFCDTENVCKKKGFFGNGQGGVFIEPWKLAIPKDTPLEVKLLLASGPDVQSSGLVSGAGANNFIAGLVWWCEGKQLSSNWCGGHRVTVIMIWILGRLRKNGRVFRRQMVRRGELFFGLDMIWHLSPQIGGNFWQFVEFWRQVAHCKGSSTGKFLEFWLLWWTGTGQIVGQILQWVGWWNIFVRKFADDCLSFRVDRTRTLRSDRFCLLVNQQSCI